MVPRSEWIRASLQPGGKLVVAGSAYSFATGAPDFALARYQIAERCRDTGSFHLSGLVKLVKAKRGDRVSVPLTVTGPGACTDTDTRTTDGRGNYAFEDLPEGTYRLTPSKVGCRFRPESRTVLIAGVDAQANFRASCR